MIPNGAASQIGQFKFGSERDPCAKIDSLPTCLY